MKLSRRRELAGLSVAGLIAAAAWSPASAQTYLSAFGAYTDADDVGFAVAPGTIDTSFDDGLGLGVAYGTRLGPVGANGRWRIEGELSWRSNDVDDHRLNGSAPLAGSDGELNSTALMANLLVDFNEAAQFTPYVGAGIGFAKVEASDFGTSGIPDVLDDDATEFAWQFIAGAGWDVSPTAELFAEYRYFATADASVTTSTATGSVDTDISYDTNNVTFGIRFWL